jgi:flagellar protein FliO/FliZ
MRFVFSAARRAACIGLATTLLLPGAAAYAAGEPTPAATAIAAPSTPTAAVAKPSPVAPTVPAAQVTTGGNAVPVESTSAPAAASPTSNVAATTAAAPAPSSTSAAPVAATETPPAATVAPGPYAAARAAQATPAAATPSSAAGGAVASAGSLTQAALVLLLIVGLIGGVAWLLRRLGMVRNDSGTTVRIVSGVSLSNRERILVVEVADQWIVVGVAPGCINTLATMPRQESPATTGGGMAAPAGKNFALWLKQTIDKRNRINTNNTNNINGDRSDGNGI